jgi:hypothetical protein
MVVLLATGVAAQPASPPLPSAYEVRFENDWVRVTHVLYEPWIKLRSHSHTPLASAYVYLNDGGPVAFRHIGASYGAATRPPTKAGSYRLFRGIEEVHEVENLSPLPSEFLRVEFKTDPVDPTTLKGRFFSSGFSTAGTQRAEFENAQLRVVRFTIPALGQVDVPASDLPALVAVLAGSEKGSVRWVEPGQTDRFTAGDGPEEFLRFELKTRPLRANATPHLR